MGYRSDVAFLITSATPEQLHGFIATLKLANTNPEIIKALNEHCVLTNKGLGFYANDWKWYEGYTDVDALEAVWQSAVEHEEDFDLSGVFVRIGESDDDNESRSFGPNAPYDYLRIHRNLDIDFSTDKADDIRTRVQGPGPEDPSEGAGGAEAASDRG